MELAKDDLRKVNEWLFQNDRRFPSSRLNDERAKEATEAFS